MDTLLQPANPNRLRAALLSAAGTQFVTFFGSSMPRWLKVTSRHDAQTSMNSRSWRRLVNQFQQVHTDELLQRVNQEINKATYVSDEDNWGAPDYWATPQELLERGGDCEDYAIAKYLVLRDLGISPSRMQIAVSETHAVLIVTTQEGPVVLDSGSNEIRPLKAHAMKKVVFTANDLSWSVNVGRSQYGLASR